MVFLHHILCMIFQEKCFSLNNQIPLSDCIYFLRYWVKAPEHEYIFSKYSWNLIENIILIIFRRVAWNFSITVCAFVYLCMFAFENKNKFLNLNRFSLNSLKISSFKSNWFDLKCEILNLDWRQKMRFFIFRIYCRKIVLRIACSKYFRNI